MLKCVVRVGTPIITEIYLVSTVDTKKPFVEERIRVYKGEELLSVLVVRELRFLFILVKIRLKNEDDQSEY